MENKEVQALDSEYLLSLMKQANTDKDAAFELGKQYMNGTKIPQDTRRVLFYFQQATDLGHSVVRFQVSLVLFPAWKQ